MMNIAFKTTLSICLVAAIASCSNTSEDAEKVEETEQIVDQDEAIEEPEEVVEESPFGNFSGLVGQWTVDAATAGVKLDLAFDEDGSFRQDMGPVHGVGSWSRIDDEHIKIVTQNTKTEGQKWKVSDLTENTVNLTWNLESAKPKTIPMTRVK